MCTIAFLPLAIGIPLIRAQPFYLLGILSQVCFRFKLGFVGLGWVTSQPWQNQAVRKVRCTILSRTFCDLQVSSLLITTERKHIFLLSRI